jgi:hypothetical protein
MATFELAVLDFLPLMIILMDPSLVHLNGNHFYILSDSIIDYT